MGVDGGGLIRHELMDLYMYRENEIPVCHSSLRSLQFVKDQLSRYSVRSGVLNQFNTPGDSLVGT